LSLFVTRRLARKKGYSYARKTYSKAECIRVMANPRLSPLDDTKTLPSIHSGRLAELPINRWMQESGGLNLAYFQAIFVALPNSMTPQNLKSRAKLMAAHGVLNAQVMILTLKIL